VTNERRERATATTRPACRIALGLLALAALGGGAAPARANDVVIDEVIDCSIDMSCADVFQVRCPERSRYLCANVENTATVGSSEKHTFHLASVGTSPAAFLGVGGMTVIPPQEDHSVCLEKPTSSPESSLKGLVTVTRTFGGTVAFDGPDTYRLTAFCVSDEDGANKTIATLEQDE
jgi:hypothetical protein